MSSKMISQTSPDLAKFAAAIMALESAGTLKSTFQPILDAREAAKTVTPVQSKPRKSAVVKSNDKADWAASPAKLADHATLRMVACEMAVIHAYGVNLDGFDNDDIVIDGFLLEWPSDASEIAAMTAGDVSERYRELRAYGSAVADLDWSRKSTYYAQAAATLNVTL